MDAVISCIWCKENTRVNADSITVIQHRTTLGYEFSRLFQAQCPRCYRHLNWHRPIKDSFRKAEDLLDSGANLDLIELTAAELHFFQEHLKNNDYLVATLEHECYIH